MKSPLALSARVRPEALLATFNRALRRLNASAPVIDGAEAGELARDLLRQTLTAELISGHYLIAVAGLQGAGKSTLVRQLYDLDPGWLPEDLGIGERMPVMIVESTSAKTPRGYAIEIDPDKRSALRTVELNPEDWLAGLRGRRDQLIARLEVPATVFGLDDLGLLLLPGFEPHSDSPWQTLMRQALIASPAAVVVTDQSRLASPAQRVITESLRTQYLEGRRPIVAVTRTEAIAPNSDEADALRRSAASAFDISEEQAATTVVLTGDDSECRARWRPELCELLLAVHSDGALARRRQLDQMHDVIRDEGNDVIAVFREALDLWTAQNEDSDDGYREQLARFDDQVKLLRSDFGRAVRRHLDLQFSAACTEVESRMEAHGQFGHQGLIDRLRAFLKIEQVKHQREFRALVGSVWVDTSSFPRSDYDSITTQGVARVLGYAARPRGDQLPVLSSSQGTPPSDPRFAVDPLTQIGREVAELSRLGEDSSAQVSVHAVQLLPVIAFELMALSMSPSAAAVLGADQTPGESDWAGMLSDLTGQRNQLLTALVGFVGVEIAKDGKPPSIANLARMMQKAFNPSLAVGAAVSSAAIAAAAAVSAVAGAAVVLHYANAADLSRLTEAKAALRANRDACEAALEASFDDGMAKVREILAARLRRHLRIDEDRNRVWDLEKALADFRQARLDLLEACRAESGLVG